MGMLLPVTADLAAVGAATASVESAVRSIRIARLFACRDLCRAMASSPLNPQKTTSLYGVITKQNSAGLERGPQTRAWYRVPGNSPLSVILLLMRHCVLSQLNRRRSSTGAGAEVSESP